jgi:hypothetical protein
MTLVIRVFYDVGTSLLGSISKQIDAIIKKENQSPARA